MRKSLLCKSFNELYTDFVAERADSMRVREMREFLSEQLSSMEDILSDLSFRAGQVRSVDPQLSARVREHFSNLGYPNDESLRLHRRKPLSACGRFYNCAVQG